MRGPYLLRPIQIDMCVPFRVGGVYALGNDTRHIRLVGYTAQNLRDAIREHWNQYQFFWFQTCLSPRDAYIRACRQYHRCVEDRGLDDVTHPVVPKGVDQNCPVCGLEPPEETKSDS